MAGRKKSAAINDLLASGLVSDGELLRYKNKQGQLLLIGRARYGGIEVKGSAGLLNFTAFEAAAGSKYHRPAEHTHSISSKTLQILQLSMAAAASDAAPEGGRAQVDATGEPLFDDDHDAFCYVCGLGGDIICCETCSATMHVPCAGLDSVPEGDWHCPWCHCGACGQPGGWAAEGGLLPTGVAWVECGARYSSMAGLAGSGLYRPPFVGGPEAPPKQEVAAEGVAGADPGAQAPVPGQPAPADVAACMDVDEGAGTASQAQQAGSVAVNGIQQPEGGAASAPAGGEGTTCVGAAAAPGALGGQEGSSGGAGGGRLDLSQLLAILAEAAAAPPPPASHGAAGADGTSPTVAPVAASAMSPTGTDAAALAAAEARCPATGRRHHGRCLPPAAQQALQQGSSAPLWFSSRPAELLSWRLAQLCSRGLVPLGALGDGTPLSFQLVRGAAVARPQDCCGYAPQYSEAQRQDLRVALSAAAHILQSCYEPLLDSRTGGDALLWMLRGACLAGRQLDFSAMHTALLYVGSSLAAAACVRVLGPEVAEVPLLATRPELQHNKLGSALLAVLESLAAAASSGAAAVAAGAGPGEAAGLSHATGAAEQRPLLLTPAFWGPGNPYLAYPPGQPGVPDVVPIMQARWGYALATRDQLHKAWQYALVRLPGLLLACKQLGGAGAGPLPPAQLLLPRRLVLSEADCDVGAMLREGTAVVALREAEALAKDEVAADLPPSLKQEQEGLEGPLGGC